jgi:hypothetical protein
MADMNQIAKTAARFATDPEALFEMQTGSKAERCHWLQVVCRLWGAMGIHVDAIKGDAISGCTGHTHDLYITIRKGGLLIELVNVEGDTQTLEPNWCSPLAAVIMCAAACPE